MSLKDGVSFKETIGRGVELKSSMTSLKEKFSNYVKEKKPQGQRSRVVHGKDMVNPMAF